MRDFLSADRNLTTALQKRTKNGGDLELKKIGDIADEHGVATAIHMAESPVACLAAVHTAA